MRSASPSFLSQLPCTSMLCFPLVKTHAYGPPCHDSMRLAGQLPGWLHGRIDDCLADLAALGKADVGRDLRPHERGCVKRSRLRQSVRLKTMASRSGMRSSDDGGATAVVHKAPTNSTRKYIDSKHIHQQFHKRALT